MTSTDREILISIQGQIHRIILKQDEQDKRLDRIESRLDRVESRLDRVESRLTNIETTQEEHEARLTRMEKNQETIALTLEHTDDKIDWLQHTIYWGFAILAIIVAYCTISPKHKSANEKNSANDNAPALIQSIIDLLRFTRESEKH